MTDSAGALECTLSRTLWSVAAAPLLAFAWHVVVARRAALARQDADLTRAVAASRSVGLASTLLATAATVVHEVVTARAPAGARALFDPLVRCARIGHLDVGIDLWFDRFSAVECCLVCVVALEATGFLMRRSPAPREWRVWAWLELTVAGALLSSTADGFVATAMGWALVAAAATWLGSWTDGRAAVVTAARAAAGIAALTVAASLLFWGLGGAWRDGEYVPDALPRLAAVRLHHEPAGTPPPASEEGSEEGPGSLTLTSMQGARVFVDEARAPAMRAPFVRATLPAGSHVLRVHPGGSTEDALVGPFTLGSGDAVALVQLGPTLSFREIAAQLRVRNGGDETGFRPALARLASPLDAHVVLAALVILALAAGAMSASSPPAEVPAVMGLVSRAIGVVLGASLLARVAFLVPLVHERAALAIAALGVAIGVVAVGLSGRGTGLHDSLFARGPERLGALVVSFERWVIEAAAGAFATLVRAAAWVAARSDVDVVGAPADAVAARVVRIARAMEGVIGQPLGRATWAFVMVLASAVIAHAVWPAR